MVTDERLPEQRREPAHVGAQASAINGALASFYGGIAEELQLRLFLVAVQFYTRLPVSGRLAAWVGWQPEWLAHATRTDRAEVRRDLAVASALRQRWTLLDDALAQALVNPGQARAIARALAELPSDVEPEVVAKAEA